MRKVVSGLSLLVLLALLALSGCGPAGGDKGGGIEVDDATVHLGDGDNGSRVKLDVGAILAVTLESNPTTGYSWEVVEDGAPVLAQLGDSEYVMDETEDPPAPGTGGVETWHYQAAEAGEAKLTLIYHRPWEEDVEPIMTYTLEIVVR